MVSGMTRKLLNLPVASSSAFDLESKRRTLVAHLAPLG
jgi:hypothetical protein